MDRLGKYVAALVLCGFAAGPTFWAALWISDNIGFSAIVAAHVALAAVIGIAWKWEKGNGRAVQ